MTQPLYSVGTWDSERQAYTPQDGLIARSFNVTWLELRLALRELRSLGYGAWRKRTGEGEHDSDWTVLVERTDGKHWKSLRAGNAEETEVCEK